MQPGRQGNRGDVVPVARVYLWYIRASDPAVPDRNVHKDEALLQETENTPPLFLLQ